MPAKRTPPEALPPSWAAALAPEFDKPYFAELMDFLKKERHKGEVYPPEGQVFSAFHLTPLEQVKVLILGQDPYHGPGQAHGLAFSVAPGVPTPPSLNNMFKELCSELGCPMPRTGSLIPWAQQGVMLLNAVLTVRAGTATSHQGKGWEKFTDAVIKVLSERQEPMIFVLWGSYARKKAKLIDATRHKVLEGIHPSPLSAHQGFFGSKPYSKVNQLLTEMGQAPIRWELGEGAAASPKAAAAAPPKDKPRARPTPPPHPAVLSIKEALGKKLTPRVHDLLQALQLATWDDLASSERGLIAQAVAGVLPRGFELKELQTHACGSTQHEVAFYLYKDARFALVPGGDPRLGWLRAPVHLSEDRRREWRKAFEKSGGPKDPEAWLDLHLTLPRTARITPLLIEVAPARLGKDYLKKRAEKGGLDSHATITAALAQEALRLVSSDEWEHACAAGARTLFRWGDTWPMDLEGDGEPHARPNAFGLQLPTGAQHPDATDDPDVYRGGDGGAAKRAGAACFEGWAPYASSFAWDLRRIGAEDAWQAHLEAAAIRRVRPVFPYAKP